MRAFAFVAALCAAFIHGSTALACDDYVTDLIVGQYMDVGEVTVSLDGDTLTVTYLVDDASWYLTETHLYVGATAPKKAAPGQFPFAHDDMASDADTYEVSLASLGLSPDDVITIAAHGVVESFLGYEDPDLDEFLMALPTGTFQMTVAYPGGDSYLDTTVSGDGLLDGTWDGWCIDTSHDIEPGLTYTAVAYSSYDPALPAGLVDYPENLDMINWIINQDFVGTTSPGGYGTYTMGDVQRAIWELIDDTQSAVPGWSGLRVNEIVAAAYANGEGYEPSDCTDRVAVILQPIDELGETVAQLTIAQVTFIDLGIECPPMYADETVWAEGTTQFKTGWGWTFEYTCEP